MESGSLRGLRKRNRERLLELLRVHGRMHRAELARQAGLSRQSVSTIVTQLLEEDLVAEVEDGEGRLRATPNGRPRKLLTLNPAGGVALGMYGLLDASGPALLGLPTLLVGLHALELLTGYGADGRTVQPLDEHRPLTRMPVDDARLAVRGGRFICDRRAHRSLVGRSTTV
jgi:predicted transcriptional regulator